MFPTYVAILSAIEGAEELTIEQLYRVTDVRGGALRHICNSMVSHGYLEASVAGGYGITPSGQAALREGLNEVEMVSQVINKT